MIHNLLQPRSPGPGRLHRHVHRNGYECVSSICRFVGIVLLLVHAVLYNALCNKVNTKGIVTELSL